MINTRNRWFYITLNDWTWWVWSLTTVLLLVGLFGQPLAFLTAIVLTAAQGVVFIVRERSLSAFSVQIRLAYLVVLLLASLPGMQWLYWLPTIGTLLLVIFGYCLLARSLSLMPWNSDEPYSLDRLRHTFFSRPNLSRVQQPSAYASCAGGLCTIEAQVAPATPSVDAAAFSG